jgi:mycothiol system anti-sigma-R factor
VIQQHLDDCTPCLRKYGIEREVKALVARCCGQEDTPTDLRDRVLVALRSTTVVSDGHTTTITTVEVTDTQ